MGDRKIQDEGKDRAGAFSHPVWGWRDEALVMMLARVRETGPYACFVIFCIRFVPLSRV